MRFSIVTPSYNQGHFLGETILSVVGQGAPSVEYIVIDGGSTDDSVSIIKSYEDRISYWESKTDRGQSHAINKGFARSTGEICGWINSDDLLEPRCLQRVGEWFEANPSKDWLVGSARIIDSQGHGDEIREAGMIEVDSMVRWCTGTWFAQQATFWRRSAIVDSEPLREDLHFGMDWELWLRLFHRSGAPGVIPDVLGSYRIHDDAKCVSSDREVWDEYLGLLGVLAAGDHQASPSFGKASAMFLAECSIKMRNSLKQALAEKDFLEVSGRSIRKSTRSLASLLGSRFRESLTK